jgi:hypothetical protein
MGELTINLTSGRLGFKSNEADSRFYISIKKNVMKLGLWTVQSKLNTATRAIISFGSVW